MKVLKMLEPVTVGTVYGPGDVAGFEDAVADDLIARKLATPVAKGNPSADKGGEAAPVQTDK